MKAWKLRVVWTALSCGLALLFAVYVVLDTFLLTRVEGSAQAENLSMFLPEAADAEIPAETAPAEEAVETEIAEEEVQELLRSGKPAGRICALCTRDLAKYYERKYGRKTFGVIDSVVMMAALYPEIMETVGKAYCTIELSEGETRGHMAVDLSGQTGQEPNAEICTRIDALRYKERMFALLK